MRVLLAGHLLGLRQDRLHLADVDQHQPALRGLRVGLHHPGDDVALAPGVLAEGLVVLGVAQPLQDDLAGSHGRHPAEVGRRVVVLLDDRALVVEVLRPDDHLAGLPVDRDAGVRHGVRRVLVGAEQRGLQGADQVLEGDLLLTLDAAQGGQVDGHHRYPPPPAHRGG